MYVCLVPSAVRARAASATGSGAADSCVVVEGGELGLYKRFACLVGEWGFVNTILGIQHFRYRNSTPLYFAINIAQYMVSPHPPRGAIQYTILVMTISCKGQGVSQTRRTRLVTEGR